MISTILFLWVERPAKNGVSFNTEEEVKEWIKSAKFSTTVWNGEYENFYSFFGAAYVNTQTGTIRTAYRADEYTDNLKRIMEVLEGEH